MLSGRHILLGVSGGIAAYKTAFLIRLFKQAGADVRVILTEAASHFVSPLTLSVLSEHPVQQNFTVECAEGTVSWNNHVELAQWADMMVIAPCTANTLSKMVSGTADNFLLVAYMSTSCPVFVAPAMDLDMYAHPSTQAHLKKLADFGHSVIPAETGFLASGLHGTGRMAEPEHILAHINQWWMDRMPLRGMKILITAGPTHEPIDPVRFIGNQSSGRMGIALADQAARLGAEVVLVLGPSALAPQQSQVVLHRVQTAVEMLEVCTNNWDGVDVAIFAAAVADYRPEKVGAQKIKRSSEPWSISMVPNPDIAAHFGAIKGSAYLVGFALETQNGLSYAQKKRTAKNLDAIVLNSLEEPGAGFGMTNVVHWIDKSQTKSFELMEKTRVAEALWEQITTQL